MPIGEPVEENAPTAPAADERVASGHGTHLRAETPRAAKDGDAFAVRATPHVNAVLRVQAYQVEAVAREREGVDPAVAARTSQRSS